MNTEKRLMLAVAFSVLIIIGYQAYMRQFAKPYQAPEAHDTVVSEMAPVRVDQQYMPSVAHPAADTTVSFDTVMMQNKNMQITTSNYGGTINEIYLLDYISKDSTTHCLLAENLDQPQLLETVFLQPDVDKMWELSEHTGTMARYRAESGGVEIIKTISLDSAGYALDVVLTINNTTDNHKTAQYIINNGFIETARGHIDSRYIGADIMVDDNVIRRRPSNKTLDSGETIPGNPLWVASRGRYFSFVLKPRQDMQGSFVKSISRNDIYTGLISNPINLMPKASVVQSFILYAGPNDLEFIGLVAPSASNIIHYGFFHGIGRVLFSSLKLLYSWTGNYGVAILLLSLVISLIMLPLTRKSLHSMKEMQKIQPETEMIRKQYSDNPQKMNKEIMELYKKHKINPIGGCLPMVLQIPIFFSLYQVLLRSVELKGASFLWIKDLSEPDAAFALPHVIRNLPFLGGNINILPIMMAIAMAFQQRLSQGGNKQMSDQQRMMAGIMPIMFGFIFYNMPSGLVLYWFTNTLFMLLIQEVVLKARVPAHAE